jgi:hypothetical protein
VRITGTTALAALLAAACAVEPSPERAAGTPLEAALPATMAVVDSALPVEAELRRFRVAAGAEARELRGGGESRDALVGAFLQALHRQDTAALRRMLLTPAEFASLYYPYTIYTHPPYTQSPGMVWMRTAQNSQKGLSRLLQRYGGRRLDAGDYRCAAPEPQDLNVLHADCGVVFPGDPLPRSLFGTIIERNGRFKFVSYANGL